MTAVPSGTDGRERLGTESLAKCATTGHAPPIAAAAIGALAANSALPPSAPQEGPCQVSADAVFGVDALLGGNHPLFVRAPALLPRGGLPPRGEKPLGKLHVRGGLAPR